MRLAKDTLVAGPLLGDLAPRPRNARRLSRQSPPRCMHVWGPKHLLTNRRHKNTFSLGRGETCGTRATNFDGVASSFTWATRSITEPAESIIGAADYFSSARRRADPGRIPEETRAFRVRVSSEAELSTEDLPSAGEILKLSGPPSSCQNCPASSEQSCQVPSKIPRAPASLLVDKALPGSQGNARESPSTSSSSATPSH